jgi:hypothetical protein
MPNSPDGPIDVQSSFCASYCLPAYRGGGGRMRFGHFFCENTAHAPRKKKETLGATP